MSNSEIEQSGTVKGRLPNEASLSGRISNELSLSGHISIGGAGDFIIKMTLAIDDDGGYTLASCDATVEQIDEAVAAEKRVVVIASDGGISFELPMLQGVQGSFYFFGTFLNGQMLTSFVEKIDESTSKWQFLITQIEAESVNYSDDALPNVTNVRGALDKLVPNSHSHTNKDTLDKLSDSNGKLKYDGEALGSDFIIKMTVTSDDNGNYTVTSCDTTVEQIDAAVASEKRVVVIATDTDNNLSWDIPIVQGFNGSNYYFATFLLGQAIISFVQKISENQDRWQFVVSQIGADFISYSNDAFPNHISTVRDALNELVPKSHSHTNKSVLDKFAESDGKPTYNGESLGSGAGDLIIKMTVESHDDGNYYTVASCDATIEQIDAAVAAEKRVVLIATDTTTGMLWEMPIVQAFQGETYIFIAFTYSGYMMATVYKSGENEIWEFTNGGISAESIDYYNSTQQVFETVMAALNKLFDKSHDHVNKSVLDKLSVSNGKLQYNGSDVGLKPVKGTDYWTAADKTEIVNDTLAALPTWVGGGY